MNTKTFISGAGQQQADRRSVRNAVRRIRIWDLPTRIFHWGLVLAVGVAVVSGEIGGSLMALHAKAGLAVVGLLAFRLAWGFVGSTYARFLSFVPTPARIRAYLCGRWHGHGHNPLGALSVLALLGLLALQAGSGLFGTDDIAFTGPLYRLVDETLALRLTGWHQQLAYVLLALLALHVLAIVFYLRVKKDNLVKPMVTGWKHADQGESASKGGWLALLLALAVAAGAVYVASGAALEAPAAVATPAASQGAPAW